jgi:hypothetical protein
VHHEHAAATRGGQKPSQRGDNWTQQGYVIAQGFSETSGFQKITLHVDDQQRGFR